MQGATHGEAHLDARAAPADTLLALALWLGFCVYTHLPIHTPVWANGVFSHAVGLSSLLASTQLLAGLRRGL